jgi:hypothetical protein
MCKKKVKAEPLKAHGVLLKIEDGNLCYSYVSGSNSSCLPPSHPQTAMIYFKREG